MLSNYQLVLCDEPSCDRETIIQFYGFIKGDDSVVVTIPLKGEIGFGPHTEFPLPECIVMYSNNGRYETGND